MQDKIMKKVIYPNGSAQGRWQTADDRVMGGVSVASLQADERQGSGCYCLSGQVSLDNRGGFLQMKWEMDKDFDASTYTGIYVDVLGNNEDYNIHVRTEQLWLPWQSFRYTFHATPQWQVHYVPFSAFENYKTWSSLDAKAIAKMAIVAIGRSFSADVCVREWGFYKA